MTLPKYLSNFTNQEKIDSNLCKIEIQKNHEGVVEFRVQEELIKHYYNHSHVGTKVINILAYAGPKIYDIEGKSVRVLSLSEPPFTEWTKILNAEFSKTGDVAVNFSVEIVEESTGKIIASRRPIRPGASNNKDKHIPITVSYEDLGQLPYHYDMNDEEIILNINKKFKISIDENDIQKFIKSLAVVDIMKELFRKSIKYMKDNNWNDGAIKKEIDSVINSEEPAESIFVYALAMFKQFTGDYPRTHHVYNDDEILFDNDTEEFVKSRFLEVQTTSEYIKDFAKLNQLDNK